MGLLGRRVLGSQQGSDGDFLAAIGGVELHAPVKHTKDGTFGPVYAVKKVGGIELPKPALRERISYFTYKESLHLWEELTIKYKQ